MFILGPLGDTFIVRTKVMFDGSTLEIGRHIKNDVCRLDTGTADMHEGINVTKFKLHVNGPAIRLAYQA